MREIYLFFVVILPLVVSDYKKVSDNKDDKRFRCDYEYYPEADGWLKVHKIPADFAEARLRCQLEGAVLASPITNNLLGAILSMMDKHGRSKAYMGIHATVSRGDFHSIEGVPLADTVHAWAAGEPNNLADSESCIVMNSDGTIMDVDCRATYSYVCYHKDNHKVPGACGTIDEAYTLDSRTGHCYKFHRVPRIYSRAFMACSAEGGYLTIINSETEAQVIREVFAKNLPSDMVGPFWKEVAFVGFHDWHENNDWLTVHGETLEQAGYAKYAAGEPNNITTGEHCGGLYRSALFLDLHCDQVTAFICEKTPDSLVCK